MFGAARMVKNKYLPLQHQNKRHFLFVFATTTPEKIEQYNAIARWLKLPMTFMCLKEISDFHSPDEDTGKRLENSEQKFHEIKGPIQLIQGERRYQDILRRICTQLDIPFDLQNIFVLTEDSTISLLLRTWVRLKQSLAPYIPGAILNSAERDQVKYKGSRKTFVGPAAELGPIMSAVTVPAFFSMIENSANDERSANIPLLEQITIILHRLADDLAERKDVLHSKTDMKVVPPAPAGTDRTLVYHTGQHEALHIDQLNRNAAGWFRNFLPTKSARAKMIENLYKRALSSPYAPPKHTDRYLKEAGRLVSHVPFFVRQFAGDKLELSSFKKSSKGFIAPEPSGTASCYDVINLEPNFAKSDAFLLGPIGSKAVCRRWATFQFFSLTVEKPIEARSYRKPIVIANDGSWDSALDLYFQLVNNGMSKDYDRSLYEDPLFSGHQMTGLFDVVNEQPSGRCTNKRLANAADKVLRLRRRDYFSFASNDAHRTLRHPHAQSALPNLDDKFSVGVLTSATSDNKILIDTLDRFGACLARQRWCLIWG
ncbi:MAG TPA: hypothetical protein VMV79_01570, partial [Alphaproteobacteria bacterium]|nr:hypothetical protein [Alphaproteobacteria bacterium]